MKVWVKWILGAITIIAIGSFVGWRILKGNIKIPIRTVSSTYQTITKDVAFTASIAARESSNLAFELTGSIQDVYVHVGDAVVKGQKLALLNPENVTMELAKAKADTSSSTSVQYLTWQKAVDEAKNTKAENAKILAQKRQAVRDAKISFDQSQDVYNAKSGESGESASATKSTYSTVIANQGVYKAAQKTLETTLQSVTKSNTSATKSAEITYAQYINTIQKSSSDTGLSSLGALEQLATIRAAKSTLRAPFNGVITKRNAEIGEFVTAGQEVFIVATVSDLEITANVPETDALAMASGMSAEVTFDALPSQTAIATTITTIAPAAIIIQGVPTFTITLSLPNPPAHLRPGLTSNVIVHVDKKDHVLGIPRRSVIIKNGKTLVKIQRTDASEEERYVTTGLTGSDGTIEITSGLAEGDIVITP